MLTDHVSSNRNAYAAASMTPAAVAVTWFFGNVVKVPLSTEEGAAFGCLLSAAFLGAARPVKALGGVVIQEGVFGCVLIFFFGRPRVTRWRDRKVRRDDVAGQ